MAFSMAHPDIVLPGQTVNFFTTEAELIEALGTSGPIEATVASLHGDNVVDLEVEIGKLYRITVTEVPCSEEGARRWAWVSGA